MSQNNPPIVDPELLTRLAGLSYRIGRRVEGTLTGRHRSPYHGASVEFAQHREYVPGDEIRYVDWKSFARSDRHFVKQFEDETNLRVFIVVDTSGSMGFGMDGGETKLNYACRLAAAIAWLFIRQGDAVGLLPVGESVGSYIPPRAQPQHFWRLTHALEGLEPSGTTRLSQALEYIAELPARRSLVIVLSDCFEFEGRFTSLARQLHRRAHNVSVLHVLDRAELEFPFRELTVFEEMESDDRLQVDPRAMREEYLNEFNAWCETLQKTLQEGRVDYSRLATDQALESCIRDLLVRGAQ